MRLYSFFFHYRKQTQGMTVHFRGKCYPCKYVNCQAPCYTKYNKTQPQLVMAGKAYNIVVENDLITIK